MNLFTAVLYLHIATVAVSVGLFVLRYWWMYHQSPLLNQRWVRIAPHCSDTLLFLSGAGLMAITHYLPFTEDGAWLTEKLFGVIIYIALGFIALGRRRPRSQQEPLYRVPAGAGGVVYHHSTRHHKNTDTGVGHGVISGFRI